MGEDTSVQRRAAEGGDLSALRHLCEQRLPGWPTDKQADFDQARGEMMAADGNGPHGSPPQAAVLQTSSAPPRDATVQIMDYAATTLRSSDTRPVQPPHTEITNIVRAGRDGQELPGFKVGEYTSLNDQPGRAEANTDNNTEGQHTGEKPYKRLVELDPVKIASNNEQLKVIFDEVVRAGTFNYAGARVPLPSGLNIPEWCSMLRGYSDFGITQYLEFGWPIGIDRDAALRSEGKNHASALAHPADIEHYLATELSHQALLGPFAGPPASTCHFSPLMTRPKKGSKFRRVIIDLSWPRGYSINDGISTTEYIDGPLTISLPTHDDMERAVVRAGRGAFLYKTDLSRGYRQLRVDPFDWPYLSFRHGESNFMDICPPFGLRSSAMAMQRVSQAIVHLHGRRGYVSRAYIDDFGGVESAECTAHKALAALQSIMNALGVQQAVEKICLPAQVMVWLGIEFDSLAMSMTIPKEKMGEIMQYLGEWGGKLRATRKEIQSLLGLLNFVASVAPPVRLFTNRMLDNLRETPPVGATSLSHQFKLDVKFFQELLPIFNGRKVMGKQVLPYQHQVELDACLSGCGAVAGDQFYAAVFPREVVKAAHTIAHLEWLRSRCGGSAGQAGPSRSTATT